MGEAESIDEFDRPSIRNPIEPQSIDRQSESRSPQHPNSLPLTPLAKRGDSPPLIPNVRKVLLQIPMNEDVAAACALDKEAIFGLLEEGDKVPRDEPGAVENEAEGKVLNAGFSTTTEECSRQWNRSYTKDDPSCDCFADN